MSKVDSRNLIRGSLLNNQILGGLLILLYCMVYGITVQIVLAGMQLVFFLGSVIFALSVFYIRDPGIQKAKIRKGIFCNQAVGTALVFIYLLVYGMSSLALLNGLQLLFFMSSYVFAMSIFYIRDPERIKQSENVSYSSTTSGFVELNPSFINSDDLNWLVRELNSSLTVVIGFCELMLQREYSDNEKEFIIRNIYEQALSMSHSVNKVAKTIPDSPAKPKDIHEVVDLQDDKNFK